MHSAEVAEVGHALEAWNRALAHELLDGRFEAQPLYLFLEPERLAELEASVGAPLLEVASASLAWSGGAALFRPHHRAAAVWEAGGKQGPPPFLAILVALAAAAAAMVSDHNFSGTNYRDRLCRLLGATGDRAEKVKRDLPGAVSLWQSLNDWLDDWEGALGLPTARVLGRLVNVGYPISQALVRQGDRLAMRDAFERYGLTPRRRVGVAEMTAYLADWVGRGHAPSNLTRLWSDTTVQERIAQVACDELEHGTAATAMRGGGTAAPPAKLEWLAHLALEPVPSLELFLASRADPSEAQGRWQVGACTDAGGTAAVADCRDVLEMQWLPALGVLSLEPWDRIGVTSLFSGVLELTRQDLPGVHLVRSPGAVIVLTFDERDGHYHEVSRAQLLDRCLVLAHESLAGAVAKHLAVYARPGFRRLDAETLPQLPLGWTAFVEVTLVQGADDSAHGRLAGLCAAPATVIGVTGGLRIGHNTWHLSQAPEALAVVEPETAPFRLLVQDRRVATRRLLGTFVGRGAVDLATLELAAGDYELQIERARTTGPEVVRRATFRLRSADHPRPVGVRQDPGLGYDLARPWSLLSAQRAAGDPPSSWLRGGIWPDASSNARPGALAGMPALEAPVRRLATVERPAPRATRTEAEGRTHSCTVGPHHWDCEAAGPDDDFKTLKWQDCRYCHRFEWTRNRGKATGHTVGRAARVAPRQPSTMPRYAALSGAAPQAYDRLLDALSYMGSGSADLLRGLCADLDPDPLFAWRAPRDLAALGHIDVEFDPGLVRPRTWQITSPCLVETAGGGWVLTGARSQGLVSALGATLQEAGLELTSTVPDKGPALWRVMADFEQLASLPLPALVTPLGAGVEFSPRLAERIAAGAPLLSDLAKVLPLFQVGARGLERYDLATATWGAADFDCPGAYRLDHWGRTYGFAGAGDLAAQVMRLADPALAKHLAAQAQGVSLLAYDPAGQALSTPLGAELPPLLERAAVACSGALPRLRADLGQLEYGSISAEMAAAIQQALHAPPAG